METGDINEPFERLLVLMLVFTPRFLSIITGDSVFEQINKCPGFVEKEKLNHRPSGWSELWNTWHQLHEHSEQEQIIFKALRAVAKRNANHVNALYTRYIPQNVPLSSLKE